MLNTIGYGPLLREYVHFLKAKLAFHRQHPEFNGKTPAKCLGRTLTLKSGLFEYEEYISLKTINDPNEGRVHPPSFSFCECED